MRKVLAWRRSETAVTTVVLKCTSSGPASGSKRRWRQFLPKSTLDASWRAWEAVVEGRDQQQLCLMCA